jgi:SAM-dependent methyltransferase
MSSTPIGLTTYPPSVAIAPARRVRPVVDAERALYTDVWANVDTYGLHSPGEERVSMFQAMSRAKGGTVLDAGCGAGRGALALELAGFDVTLCDVTDAGLTDEARAVGDFHRVCLWSDLSRLGVFDYVYCADVMEHIPTEYVMLVLHRLLSVTTKGLFLSISLTQDNMGVWVGQHLHRTVQPFTWWRDRLRDIGTLVESRDLIDCGVYLVKR